MPRRKDGRPRSLPTDMVTRYVKNEPNLKVPRGKVFERVGPLGYQSASHGAGRKMSRNAAKKAFAVEQLEESMRGIEARTDEGGLDEITYAYKDLDSVIAAESDLVEVVQKLDTILCVKG